MSNMFTYMNFLDEATATSPKSRVFIKNITPDALTKLCAICKEKDPTMTMDEFQDWMYQFNDAKRFGISEEDFLTAAKNAKCCDDVAKFIFNHTSSDAYNAAYPDDTKYAVNECAGTDCNKKEDAGDVEKGVKMFNKSTDVNNHNMGESLLESINVRDALNEIDKSLEKPCFVGMYDAAILSEQEKIELANMIVSDDCDINCIYDWLAVRIDANGEAPNKKTNHNYNAYILFLGTYNWGSNDFIECDNMQQAITFLNNELQDSDAIVHFYIMAGNSTKDILYDDGDAVEILNGDFTDGQDEMFRDGMPTGKWELTGEYADKVTVVDNNTFALKE